MPNFDELLQLLQSDKENAPETIYDDLRNAYNLTVDGGAEALKTRQEDLDAAQAEISRLKALNFDLMLSANAVDNDSSGDDTETETINAGIDGLFRVG